MRFAFFGDVVGRSGREGLAEHLPGLRRRLGLEFVIVNAENAAAGFGITENTARELFEAGAIVVDMHAEITSEKMAMGHFCDGRASLVVGTHTHVPTADAQILPGGTAFQADAGACADYDSVIGNQKEEPLRRFTTRISGGRY